MSVPEPMRRLGLVRARPATPRTPADELCRSAAACLGTPARPSSLLRHLRRAVLGPPPAARAPRTPSCATSKASARWWPPAPADRARPRRATDGPTSTPPASRDLHDERPASRRCRRARAEPAPTPAEQRPADVPEKFWDDDAGAVRTDALLKSYLELERKLGVRAGVEPEQAAADTPPSEVEPRRRARSRCRQRRRACAIAPPHPLIEPDAELNDRLRAAGFTQTQAQLVYDLAAERLLPVMQRGLGRDRGPAAGRAAAAAFRRRRDLAAVPRVSSRAGRRATSSPDDPRDAGLQLRRRAGPAPDDARQRARAAGRGGAPAAELEPRTR